MRRCRNRKQPSGGFRRRRLFTRASECGLSLQPVTVPLRGPRSRRRRKGWRAMPAIRRVFSGRLIEYGERNGARPLSAGAWLEEGREPGTIQNCSVFLVIRPGRLWRACKTPGALRGNVPSARCLSGGAGASSGTGRTGSVRGRTRPNAAGPRRSHLMSSG